jgi:hypothetical protein
MAKKGQGVAPLPPGYRYVQQGSHGFKGKHVIDPSGKHISQREGQEIARGSLYESYIPPISQPTYKSKYGPEEIKHLSRQPYKELNPYERRLVREYERPRHAAEIAARTGIDEKLITRRLDTAKVDLTSVRYLRGAGFEMKTPGGQKKIAVIVKTANGQTIYFSAPKNAARILDQTRDNDEYPELADAHVFAA